jgi:biotin synthase
MKKIYLCAISNISSGNCSEDCSFCTQSAYNKADIEKYKEKDISVVIKEAKQAQANKAIGFCLVTAGKGLNDRKLEFVCKVAKALSKEKIDLNLIACNGTATKEQLKELKKAGIKSYNHNLETSKEYYDKICQTHRWDERFETCQNVKEAGLKLCTGGIFGLGESENDRESFLDSLINLSPDSIPLNFFHPNPALPLENKLFDIEKALYWIKKVSSKLPGKRIMVAGGREITFKNRWPEIFEAGANSIVIGNYLTTKGNQAEEDIKTIESLGYEIAQNCE